MLPGTIHGHERQVNSKRRGNTPPSFLWQYDDVVDLVQRRAGLPEVGVHGLRRSFASLAYHLKWDMMTTMRIGGWDDDKVVREIYTKLSAKDIDKDVKKMRRFYQNSERNSERD